MIKGELETMEGYIQELEALRCYAQVKAERDSLATEVAQLREKVALLEAQIQSEVSTREELSSRLSKRESQLNELGIKLTKAQREASSLRDFKVELPEGGGLSLEEIKGQFLQAQEEEIDRRARERLRELEMDLRSQMPALVHKELVQVLKRPEWPPEIEEVVNSRARQMAEESLRDRANWPEWFKDYYLHEVKEAVARGLDAEFENRVQAEAEKRLEAMKVGQWAIYTAAKARELATDLKGMIGQLQGTWWFNCDRCGRRVAVDIGPSEFGELLGGRAVAVACSSCTDPAPFPFFLSIVPHRVGSLTLGGLVQLYMGKAPTTG